MKQLEARGAIVSGGAAGFGDGIVRAALLARSRAECRTGLAGPIRGGGSAA